jgi:hypothetical protein
MDISRIIAALRGHAYLYTDEHALHRAIDEALTEAEIPFAPEVNLSARDRIDYLAGDIGIEVKVKGNVDTLRRQLTRYALHPTIREFLVVTTVRAHRQLPEFILGRRVTVLVVGGGLS